MAKHNCADHPISSLRFLVKTGSKSVEARLCERWILFMKRVMTEEFPEGGKNRVD